MRNADSKSVARVGAYAALDVVGRVAVDQATLGIEPVAESR